MSETNDLNGAAAEPENYPLDEAIIGLLADIAKARDQLQRNADQLAAQEQGALVLFIRQHKLAGTWDVADNRRELTKRPEPATAKTGGA